MVRCYGSFTCSLYAWSDPSNPLVLCVTGVFTKPAISAHPGPIVRAGGNVTLRCHSPLLLHKFMLHKKVNNGHFQRCGEVLPGGHAAADFSISPMTSGSEGTYRCYGSLSRSPYVWSAPSDPVDIVITGSTARTCTSPMDPRSTEEAGLPQERSSALYIVLGLAIAFTSTSVLLAALVCHWCSTENC
ncbi:hypothetical protein Celaphus_00004890 [Cervus elaphus hippelaphus]|uniref:Ig-like domain-containing protein n=1 Tax=Cervus elaphus hippelaphus TaxID=46360 RepID=A0A212DBY8_CEREH|nr:hypothetical protein Celaphus_00004890 [Cervus elaphus hippelaphus]